LYTIRIEASPATWSNLRMGARGQPAKSTLPSQPWLPSSHPRPITAPSNLLIIDLEQGGTFFLSLVLPPTYPFKPPTVTFTTKIYHPNISNDTPPNSGVMCLGMLKVDEWKPSTKMAAVLEFARQLLKGSCVVLQRAYQIPKERLPLTKHLEPNPDDAVEAKIADQYKTDRAGYEKEAKDWTKRYANRKQ
jgi:ubiquitin-protein ligase